jgi:hypothetical protein
MAITRTIVLPVEFHPALKATLDEAHKAYRVISEMAFESKTYARYSLQELSYREVRAATKLTAQMTCSAIRRVSAAYKSMKSNERLPDKPAKFSKRCLDLEGGSRGRDFRLYPQKGIVSISTVEGRKKLTYRCGDFQRGFLESPNNWTIRGAKLLYKRRRNGWRYELHVSVVREEPERREGGIVGVDIGRRYLAVATTGNDATFFPARHLKPRKEHFRRIRGRLKSKGTRSRGPSSGWPDGKHGLLRTCNIARLKSLCGLLSTPSAVLSRWRGLTVSARGPEQEAKRPATTTARGPTHASSISCATRPKARGWRSSRSTPPTRRGRALGVGAWIRRVVKD